ncbi:hypothetical protein LguiB_025686 [Lonicera macranthoides]
MLVKGWAPQAKIFGHSSICGFVSRCGWSYVMESISFGVPIISLPMQLDHPLNARLVVEVGVGAEVMKGENEEFKREVARVIKEVLRLPYKELHRLIGQGRLVDFDTCHVLGP